MKKNIKLKILKEQRAPSNEELDSICPNLDQLIAQAKLDEDAIEVQNLKRYKSYCAQRSRKANAIRTGNTEELKSFLEQENLREMSSVFSEYYNAFVQAMATMDENTSSVVTGQDPDNVATKEENECLFDVGTHAQRAGILVATYIGFINFANYINGPDFARKYVSSARTPFSAGGSLLRKLMGLFRSGDGEKVALDIDKRAAEILGKGQALDIDNKLKDLTDEKLKGEGFGDTAKRYAHGTVRGLGRFGLWFGALATIGATGWYYLRDEEEYGTTNSTIEGVLTFFAVQDAAPKLLAVDSLYGEQATQDLAKGQFTEDPCNFIGPFLALAAIAALRSRKFQQSGSVRGQLGKYGFGEAGQVRKQLDYREYFETLAKRTARELEDQIEHFADFLRTRQEKFNRIFKETARNQNLYDNIPEKVQDVYMKWAQRRLNVNRGLADDATDDQLLRELEEAWGKNIDDLTEEELFELKYFMSSYNRGITTVTSEAGQAFNRINLSKSRVAFEKLWEAGGRAKNKMFSLMRGGDDGMVPSGRRDTDVRPNEVKGATGQSTDDLEEVLSKQDVDKRMDDLFDDIANEKATADRLKADPASGVSAAEKSGAMDRTAARAAQGLEPDDAAKRILAQLEDGNPTALLRESDEAADALRAQLDDIFEDFGETALKGLKDRAKANPQETLAEILIHINRNESLKKDLVKRIFTKYFPDEQIDDLLKTMDDVPNPVDEATVIYNNLVKKFGNLETGAQNDAIKKELAELLTDIKKDIGEYKGGATRAALGEKATAARRAAFEDGVWPFMASTTALLVGSGIVYGWYATEKVEFHGGEDGYYYVGDGFVARRAAALFNAWGGRLSLKGVSENNEILINKLLEDGDADSRQEAEAQLNVAAIRDIITLPKGIDMGEIIDNKKIPEGFSGRKIFWKTLVEDPGKFDGMSTEQVFDSFLESGVAEDMGYVVGQERGNRKSPIQSISSKMLDLPEIRTALMYRYGRPGKLISELRIYLKGAKLRDKPQNIAALDRIFSYDKARIYATSKSLKKNKKVVADVSKKTNKKIKENDLIISDLNDLVNDVPRSERSMSFGISMNNLLSFIEKNLRFIPNEQLTVDQKMKIQTIIAKIESNKLIDGRDKDVIIKALRRKLDRRGTRPESQKENKIMNKKSLQELVRAVLQENYGQGYNHYPYHSNVGVDDEPTEDFIQDWKAFELALVRDQSRDTAIQVAKILIKDLELFGDVVDLIGKNQSVATEILQKFSEKNKKSKS